MWAAIVMGTIFYAAGSLVWYGTLLAFFISSTVLSKVKKKAKAKYEEAYEKTGRRDAGQVMANGGIGMVLCLLYAVWQNPMLFWAFMGVMATVTSDTWATEIGSLSRKQPRSVLTWKSIPAGTSGGVSMLGTSAAVAGGLFIGSGIVVFEWWSGTALESDVFVYPLVGLIAGTVGAFTDSILGATCQVMYRCPHCGKIVERKDHCGFQTKQIRGLRWMNNDAVNFISSCAGGLAAIFVALVL
jgi:uncharacterized protein (TIGR00297 family)